MGGRQQDVVYKTSCYPEDNQKEVDEYVYGKRHKVREIKYNVTTKIKDIPCNCTHKPRMKKILPVYDTQDPVIVHAKCPRNLYTSFLRQIQDMRDEQKKHLNKREIQNFHSYCDMLFLNDIYPLIKDFTYEIEPWFNHLKDFKHQNEIKPYYDDYINGIREKKDWYDTTYTLFTKEEKQVVEKGKIPKTRAISACPANIKWIMGPVIIKLEEIFGKKFKGYKFNYQGKQLKTNEEIENYYDMCYKNGLTVSQDLDGSRWDTTQYHHMKYLIFQIYNWLADNKKIHHVTPQLFQYVSTARYRNLIAKYYEHGKTEILAFATVDSTTFSGSPDTTFANTLTNAAVGRYNFWKAKIDENNYEMFTAGDDYGSLTNQKDSEKLVPIIKDTWAKLGLHLKYLHCGSYETITFCSTNVIQFIDDKGMTRHKIVRQFNRMNPLSHWSIKALNYSQSEMKYYYDSLAKGIRSWANEMPLYSDYATAFEYCRDKIVGPMAEPKEGQPKVRLKTDHEYELNDFEKNKIRNRVSSLKVPDEQVYRFIHQQTGMSFAEIREYKYKLIEYGNYLPK